LKIRLARRGSSQTGEVLGLLHDAREMVEVGGCEIHLDLTAQFFPIHGQNFYILTRA
jgi:hypothetical protein